MNITNGLVTVELELTFLAQSIPDAVNTAPLKHMVDVYFPEAAAHPCLRLRQKGDSYEITKKQPLDDADSSRQTEHTITLSQQEYAALRRAPGKVIAKDRCEVTLAGRLAELDVFQGDLRGLVLIDFEFETQEAMRNFTPPACCLADVTQEAFLAGGMLAGKRYADIEVDLARYGYQPLSLS